MKNNKFVYTVLTPILVLVAIFMLFPLIYGVGIAFFHYNPLNTHNTFIGLSNFKRLLTDKVFIKAFWNTVKFVGITVPLNILISLILAQFISTLKSSAAKGFFRMMVFLPCVAPIACTAVVWKKGLLIREGGYVNVLLSLFGVKPISWLTDPSVLMFALVIFTLWADVGYNTIIFSAGMDGIPAEFYEAADIDGANAFTRFRKMTIPLLARTFVFVTMMTLISHFQMIVQFMIVVNKGGPNNAATVLSSYIYQQAFVSNNMGYASAVAAVFFVLIMVVTAIQQRVNKVDWGY